MSKPHPTFASPCVAEALCEIHFTPPDGSWKPTWFSDFFKALQPNYPTLEPQQLMEAGVVAGPGGFSQFVRPSGLKSVYRHAERPQVYQLGQSTLTINELAPYPGWAKFAEDAKFGWAKLAEVLQPKSINRLSLRYLNKFPRERATDTVGDWLAESEFYPRRLLASRSQFLSRLETSVGDGYRINVTVAEIDDGEIKPILLDIDAICQRECGTSWPEIAAELESLHDKAWEVFSSTLTDKLRKSLDATR